LRTADGDLDSSRILINGGRHAHACFHAHQAAEKALKAVWYFSDLDPWGHSIRKMIQDLERVDEARYGSVASLLEKGTFLDRFYIPTRYPNGLPDITPDEAFSLEDANGCLAFARVIVETIRSLVE